MRAALREALVRGLGSDVAASAAVSGGDVNEAFRVDLRDGRRLFVKSRADAAPGFFAREAEGLAWLAEAAALPVVRVAATSSEGAQPPWLALEWIEPSSPGRDFEATLGRGLAALHRAGSPGFGAPCDNFIGPLPQRNAPRESWAAFYVEQRLEVQLRAARDAERIDAALAARFDALFTRMPELAGPPEPPARLHGDLWSGNVLCCEAEPLLIDPAAYGGHREVDLAMLQLFGGVSERCLAAYRETHPLAPGWPERVALHQLYPLLVHVNLFGGSYVDSVRGALARYA